MVRLHLVSVTRMRRLISGTVVIAVAAGSTLLSVRAANAAPPAATAITLDVIAPAGPSGVAPGTVEILRATVFPSVAGSVQFEDSGADIGTPVIVSGGVASSTTTLSPATHSLTAVFTSTDPAFTRSTSPTVRYVVAAPTGVTATTTALSVFPSGASRGMSVVLLANVAPRGAAGTIQFFEGTTTLGAPVPASSGLALLITTLPQGIHSLAAVFTPANPAIFVPSTSPPV
jgi:Bacterial Ig-like domain (group 3)